MPLPSPVTAKVLYQYVLEDIKNHFESEEIPSVAFWLLEHFFGLSKGAVLSDTTLEISVIRLQELDHAISRLKKGEPLQYVIGEAYFYGRLFNVGPGVLIPRPETEELVHQILADNKEKRNLRVIDLGTGSGCIPITLQLELPNARVWGVDISEQALAIAQANEQRLQAHVTWLKTDILSALLPEGPFDVVVSNPPYVREMEKAFMTPRVLDHEPASALFVPDSSPLLFYEAIARWAIRVITPGGQLYFEINEALGNETVNLCKAVGFQDVVLIKDMQGKDRMIKAILN
jgi:release factor glutamine methyltransferase